VGQSSVFGGNIWIQDKIAINSDASVFPIRAGKWFKDKLYLGHKWENFFRIKIKSEDWGHINPLG